MYRITKNNLVISVVLFGLLVSIVSIGAATANNSYGNNITIPGGIFIGNRLVPSTYQEFQGNLVSNSILQINQSYNATSQANCYVSCNDFAVNVVVTNDGGSNVVAIFGEGIGGANGGAAWGGNFAGITTNTGVGVGVEANYASSRDDVGTGIQIISQDLRSNNGGNPIAGKHTYAGLLFQSNDPQVSPYQGIVFNAWNNNIDNTGVAQPALNNLVYVTPGQDGNASNGTYPINGINFQYANFSNSGIVLPMSLNHGVEFVNGSIYGAVDWLPLPYNRFVIRTNSQDLFLVNATTGIVTDGSGNAFLKSNTGVTSVGASSPVLSSGGTTPSISCPSCLTSDDDSAYAAVAQPSWNACSYQNGWSDYGNGYTPCGYMKDTLGFVHVRGTIKGGTIGQTVFNLPVGYRPAYTYIFPAVAVSVPQTTSVTSDGNVVTGGGTNNADFEINTIYFEAGN